MERRIALKNMGLVFGYTVAAPSLLGILQSCEGKKVLDWTPSFFTKDEGMVLHTLLDMILPKTDTPSATEMNVHVFIDTFAKEVLPKEHQDFLKLGMGLFTDEVLETAQKETLAELNEEDLEPVLAKYLKKRSATVEEAHLEAVDAYFNDVEKGMVAKLDDEISRYSFAGSLREMAIWSYKNTEYIGEEVLAYLPIPREYIACEDEQTLTDGRAWSL